MGGVPLARRSVVADPRRAAITVLGVGTALALILLLRGLWVGVGAQARAYPDNVGADLFVAEAGTRTVEVDTSVLPVDAAAAVAAQLGVRAVHPVLYSYTVLDLHDAKLFARLVGAGPGGLGGPWEVTRGRIASDRGEAVVDRSLAREHGIDVGDRLEVLGTPLRVVGLSERTRSWMVTFVFVTHDTASELLRMPQLTSLLLVQADDPAAVADRIEDQLGLAVFSGEEVAASNQDVLTDVMAAPVGLMIAVAFAAGTLVTSLSVYSSVVERVHEYGIAKALGASGWWLVRLVLGQTLVLTTCAGAASYAIFQVAARIVVAARPQFSIQLEPIALVVVVAAALLMALLGALAPLHRVARLDPATVYRG